MAGGVDKVELIGLPIQRLIIQRHALRFDGDAALALRSMESSTCAAISRSDKPPQIWIMRSDSVDLPWSIWAIMEKFRICFIIKVFLPWYF